MYLISIIILQPKKLIKAAMDHTNTCYRFKKTSIYNSVLTFTLSDEINYSNSIKTWGLLFIINLFTIAFSFAQSSQKSIVAGEGEGMYSILRNNGLNPVKYSKMFIELNKKNLGPGNGLYTGRTYLLPVAEQVEAKDTIQVTPAPPAKKILSYPIFGEGYSSVPIDSETLKGAVYYLVSGHGGPDPGAVEKYDGKLISEDEYAYDVTLRIARILISNGAKVYMIIKDKNDGIRDQRILEIDYDEVNHPGKKIFRSQKLRLKQRTKTVNHLFSRHTHLYQRLIVTHVDSRSKSENIDVFFYHHKNSKKGKKLAENIQTTFKQKYAKYQPNRKYAGTVGPRSDLYIVQNTDPAMVYIELGNIKNAKDQKRILDYENREALAIWIAEGLETDFTQK
ncbi:MAG: N-acetylmuramoyl-L-alanine amidase [Cyclobacteriaceae bacterium]